MPKTFILVPTFPSGVKEKVKDEDVIGFLPMTNMHLADGTVILLTANRYVLTLLDQETVARSFRREPTTPPPSPALDNALPWDNAET